ncbi:hypothetical protein GCM10010495_76610 [Kitasatospora herbaricolor]|uniref:hypothetical protein n=1 Tax=Kitasatospora herbaricolor TaxID=68217 RepID=UPI00174CE108|nr:hypothetical protein [Kitasatospora herbaricolor]MDQ0305522.1 hypothetical protein [Kitasatospora herbaricolor]GGV47614.1 hypothetical protein GCM10010495_76610 [Kitasatospora herbaricolor]
MPDALPIPADLLDLRRARDGAWAELNAYVAQIEALRREQYPDPEQTDVRARWEPEQRERLTELRAARDAAVLAVRRHPTMVQALAEGCWAATDTALFHATEPTPEPADAG